MDSNDVLDQMLADYRFFKQNRVGRVYLTEYELWKEWLL